MATYKVLQDIEAEDKLLGPLTLRQFVYAAVVIILGFIAFKLFPASPLLVIPFLPPMVFFGMLAAPFGHDQPSEVWMLAKIRFFLKPRKRIWNQDGLQELVTITVPKRIERHLTNGLNQYEVNSRLQALASTLDSRGWAIKNVSINMFSQPSYLAGNEAVSDRLVDVGSLPQEVPNYEVYAGDDIMDEQSNPTAQHLQTMIVQSEQAHRKAVVQAIHNPAPVTTATQPTPNYWFMNEPSQPTHAEPGYATFSTSPVVYPGMDGLDTAAQPSSTEEKLLEQIHEKQSHNTPIYGHMKTLQPLSDPQTTQPLAPYVADVPDPVAPSASTTQSADKWAADASGQDANPAILRLASNDDLNVATLAREAQKASPQNDSGTFDDEVVISLH